MSSDVYDRVYGCLIGGAIGDALGAPVENWHYADIRREYGRIIGFLPQPARQRDGQPGQITDDSTLRHYLCLAIIEAGGRIGPEEYTRVWLGRLNPDRLFVTERIVLEKLRLGMSPWDTGRGRLAADAAIMAIAPVGIINAGDPRQAYADAVLLAGIHQDGLERDAAATMAAGIASCFLPNASPTGVVEAMTRHATYDVRRLIADAEVLASTTEDDLVERFYQTMLDRTFPCPPGQEWDPQHSVAATSREVLPAAVAVLLRHGEDPNQALIEAAGFGRDTDTIASVVGCLVGTLHGAAALNPQWVRDCEAANSGFFAEADRTIGTSFATTAAGLVEALHNAHTEQIARAAQLASILDE